MRVYVDESGDLGWLLSFPYRNGGSSRFLCLAFLFVPKIHGKIPAGIIADLYKKYQWKHEKKAASASKKQKLEFAGLLNAMLQSCPEIKIDCIVVRKDRVQPHISADPNKLYNYMCKLVVIDYVKDLEEFEFIPDKRTIKVESGNSLSDYLQTVLWFETSSKVKLVNNPKESVCDYNLQFIDWVAHTVWAHFEDLENTVYAEISRRIKVRNLFF